MKLNWEIIQQNFFRINRPKKCKDVNIGNLSSECKCRQKITETYAEGAYSVLVCNLQISFLKYINLKLEKHLLKINNIVSDFIHFRTIKIDI